MTKNEPILASYDNEAYVAAVESGLRKMNRFDAVRHCVDDKGVLIFQDREGNLFKFEAMGKQP